jgi:hypothetical protein
MIIYVNVKFNSSDKNFEELVYGQFSIIFHRFFIDFAQSFVWLSLDNSKNISKYNYLTSFLITISYPYNYHIPSITTISYIYNYFTPFLTHQHGYENAN